MEEIAKTLGSSRPPGEDGTTEMRAHAAGIQIIYLRDDATRTVTLLDFLVTNAEP
jgi:hypothetical protein